MFAFRTRRNPGPPAGRKATLGVSPLETRECPAVLTAHLWHDLHAAPPAHPPGDDAHQPPAQVGMARPPRPLNPQPLPP